LTAELETRVLSFPSLGSVFSGEQTPEAVVLETFADYAPQILSDHRVEFMCHCSRERLHGLLTLLPIQDLKDLRDNGPFPVQMRCHNCNTAYEFSREEVQEIYGSRYPHN
jgi:molecular chaperone Hsp33